MEKLKARVTLYVEGNPFNFRNTEPHAMIYPFYSDDIPKEYRNWSLIAEKVSAIRVEKGRRFCECLVSFFEPVANTSLKPGLIGMYLNGQTAIASVEILK